MENRTRAFYNNQGSERRNGAKGRRGSEAAQSYASFLYLAGAHPILERKAPGGFLPAAGTVPVRHASDNGYSVPESASARHDSPQRGKMSCHAHGAHEDFSSTITVRFISFLLLHKPGPVYHRRRSMQS